MGFFTSNIKLGSEYANPTVEKAYQPQASAFNLGQQQQAANQTMFGGQQGGLTQGREYGSFGASQDLYSQLASLGLQSTNTFPGTDGYVGSGYVAPTPTEYPVDFQPMPTPVDDTIGAGSFDTWTDGTFDNGNATAGGYTPTAQDYQDYFASGRTILGAMTSPFGLFGKGIQAMTDYGMGINPLAEAANKARDLAWEAGIEAPYTPMFMDTYTLQGGPGSSGEYTGGVMTPSEQRDMLIEQIAFNEPTEDRGFFSNLFDPSYMGYDPDLDLSIGPWTTTTEEAVVPDMSGTITPISESGTHMDTTAGGYSWDSDWGTAEEMSEETGLGTSEWDTSHADFSWDDDGGSDDGDGDSGGGGSYIATAATQALGEEGLKVFEGWRDYMMGKLPTFKYTYGRYRVTAPKIVKAIDKKDNSENIYSYIWDMHLKPIFDLIKEDKNSRQALKDYKVMVKELQNKFLVKEKV